MDHELDLKKTQENSQHGQLAKRKVKLLRYSSIVFDSLRALQRSSFGRVESWDPPGLLASEAVRGERLDFSSAVAGGVAARAMAVVPAHLSRSVGGGTGIALLES